MAETTPNTGDSISDLPDSTPSAEPRADRGDLTPPHGDIEAQNVGPDDVPAGGDGNRTTPVR